MCYTLVCTSPAEAELKPKPVRTYASFCAQTYTVRWPELPGDHSNSLQNRCLKEESLLCCKEEQMMLKASKTALWAVVGQLQAKSVLIVHVVLIIIGYQQNFVYTTGRTEPLVYTQQHFHVLVLLHLVLMSA